LTPPLPGRIVGLQAREAGRLVNKLDLNDVQLPAPTTRPTGQGATMIAFEGDRQCDA
jgi:hypothetical protein